MFRASFLQDSGNVYVVCTSAYDVHKLTCSGNG